MIVIISLISCDGNDIYINKENKTIYSSHEIKKLSIELSKDIYFISCDINQEGDKCIRLDSIPEYYHVVKNGHSRFQYNNVNKNGYNLLFKNEFYTIDNHTIGDAASRCITFNTDSNACIR